MRAENKYVNNQREFCKAVTPRGLTMVETLLHILMLEDTSKAPGS